MKKLFLILLIALSASILFADNTVLIPTTYSADVDAVIETSMGNITLELYPDIAPLTVANFIAYADDDFYDGLIFHRVIPEFMIQGGGHNPYLVKIKPTRPPVFNEYNLSNIRGTISMAKVGKNPDSATTQFFISDANNSANLDNTNGGFTVFGRVIEDGMDVVDTIAAVDTHAEIPADYHPLAEDPNMYDVPVEDIIIYDVKILNNITVVDGEMFLEGDFNYDLEVDAGDLKKITDEWLLTDGFVDQQLLTAETETFSGEYGGAVAISKDMAIVGAPGEDDGKGAAYILKHDGTEWVHQQRLSPNYGMQGENFGFSVSIWGDMVIVGAPNKNSDAGVVYVFKKVDNPNEPWSFLGNRSATNGHAGGNFGYSVCTANGIFAVGAIGDNNSGQGDNSGAVYIFDTGGGKLLDEFFGEPGEMLGYSVAVKNRVVVAGAAYGTDPNAPEANTGTIHVFQENVSKYGYPWEETVLFAADGEQDDWLGYSVDIDNGTIIAGAGGDDDNGNKSGSVYIFDYLPTSETDPNIIWQETAKITADEGLAFDRFGWSVAIDDDNAIVGAKYNDEKGSNAGAAYLLKRDTDTGDWTQEKLLDNNGTDNDYYGHAVGISGNNVIIGAYGVDGGETNSGTVETIYINPDADLNGDGIVDLVDFALMGINWLGD